MSRKQILYWSYPKQYITEDGSIWFVSFPEMDTNEFGYWFAYPIGVRTVTVQRTIEAAKISAQAYGFESIVRAPNN